MNSKHSIFKVVLFIDSLYLYESIGFQGVVDKLNINPLRFSEALQKFVAFVAAVWLPHTSATFQTGGYTSALATVSGWLICVFFIITASRVKVLEKKTIENKGINPWGPHWFFVMVRAGLLSLFAVGTIIAYAGKSSIPNARDNFSFVALLIIFLTWVAFSFLACHLPDRRVLPYSEN